jgi:hypothetical protein
MTTRTNTIRKMITKLDPQGSSRQLLGSSASGKAPGRFSRAWSHSCRSHGCQDRRIRLRGPQVECSQCSVAVLLKAKFRAGCLFRMAPHVGVVEVCPTPTGGSWSGGSGTRGAGLGGRASPDRAAGGRGCAGQADRGACRVRRAEGGDLARSLCRAGNGWLEILPRP